MTKLFRNTSQRFVRNTLVVVLFTIVSIWNSSYAQELNLDSLRIVSGDTEAPPKDRRRAYRKLWNYYLQIDLDSSLYLSKQYLSIVLNTDDGENSGRGYEMEGTVFMYLGELDSAEASFIKSKEFFDRAEKKRFSINCLGNLGIIAYTRGDYEQAIQLWSDGLESQKEIKDTAGIIRTLSNLGAICVENGDIEKAIGYMNESLLLGELVEDYMLVASIYINLGVTYSDMNQSENALDNYYKALRIATKHNLTEKIAVAHNNLCGLYMDLDQIDSAQHHGSWAISLSEELGRKDLMCQSLVSHVKVLRALGYRDSLYSAVLNGIELSKEIDLTQTLYAFQVELGRYYYEDKEYEKAIPLLEEAANFMSENGIFRREGETRNLLYLSYKKTQDWKNSLLNLEWSNYIDSLESSENNTKALLEQSLAYEYEKKELVRKAEKAADEIEAQRLKDRSTYLTIILISALLFGLFILNRLRVTRKQKNIIDQQKATVEHTLEQLAEKNQEIVDSINYAKRIQAAHLPPIVEMEQHLGSFFLIYEPKDVVSGDFYWMYRKEETTYIAVADCTGHGVPGAMVSIVCYNALNKAVKEFALTEPAEILNKTREIVAEELNKGTEEVKDGMDIGLCAYHQSSGKLQFSGAHNPLYVISNGVLTEYKGDRQPIGVSEQYLPFSQQEIQLKKGDQFVLSSDGYADQFGGPRGKKMKAKKLKELLQEKVGLSIKQQESALLSAFLDWKGELEQLDDVSLLGVRYD